VNLPEQAQLILQLDQAGRLDCSFNTACGNRGSAVLKDRLTGDELWSEENGGAWQMSGWSRAAVWRKLGDELVKFLSKRQQSAP